MPRKLFPILLVLCYSSGLAAQNMIDTSPTSHFEWVSPTQPVKSYFTDRDRFQTQSGNITISGPVQYRNFAESLADLLDQLAKSNMNRFGIDPGPMSFTIHLIPESAVDGYAVSFPIHATDNNRLVFPFVVSKRNQSPDGFAVFCLLHALIKSTLVYGSQSRMPISSHAFRFVDGLSGYLALTALEVKRHVDGNRFLKILDIRHQNREISRRYSSQQLLEQNASSEQTDFLAGLNQFFSGISLSRNSERATALSDSSSAGDRIRVFQWIQSRHTDRAIHDIIAFLSRNNPVWTIKKASEDSFCVNTLKIGCSDQSIDGTRSDVILRYVTGLNFAQILGHVQSPPAPADPDLGDNLPAYPVYGIDFPKAGGVNQSFLHVLLFRETETITAKEIIEDKTVSMNGVSLGLGLRDEVYQVQAQIRYANGRQKETETVTYQDSDYAVPHKTATTDLQIGSRIIERGVHSGWVRELGVFFHWKRFQSEWNTQQIDNGRSDIEYVNRGYFLLDIQNFSAKKFSRCFDIGLNYDLQLGLVNQSGSVGIVRDEKYNTDFSNLVLGANLGPEIRWQLTAIHLDVRLGTNYRYLWQPLDDTGGDKGEDARVNASQGIAGYYLKIGIDF